MGIGLKFGFERAGGARRRIAQEATRDVRERLVKDRVARVGTEADALERGEGLGDVRKVRRDLEDGWG